MKVLTKNCLRPEEWEVKNVRSVQKSEVVSRGGRGNYRPVSLTYIQKTRRNYNISIFKDKIKENWVHIIHCEEVCMALKPQGREILFSDLLEVL